MKRTVIGLQFYRHIVVMNKPGIGYLVWVKMGQRQAVYTLIGRLKRRGIRHLRTGLSWCEWHYPESREWIRWYIHMLAEHFEILPNITYTPPDLGIEPTINSPP